MSMITGEFFPSEGTALLNSLDILQYPDTVRRYIGYCPQFDAHFDQLTGEMVLFVRVMGWVCCFVCIVFSCYWSCLLWFVVVDIAHNLLRSVNRSELCILAWLCVLFVCAVSFCCVTVFLVPCLCCLCNSSVFWLSVLFFLWLLKLFVLVLIIIVCIVHNLMHFLINGLLSASFWEMPFTCFHLSSFLFCLLLSIWMAIMMMIVMMVMIHDGDACSIVLGMVFGPRSFFLLLVCELWFFILSVLCCGAGVVVVCVVCSSGAEHLQLDARIKGILQNHEWLHNTMMIFVCCLCCYLSLGRQHLSLYARIKGICDDQLDDCIVCHSFFMLSLACCLCCLFFRTRASFFVCSY